MHRYYNIIDRESIELSKKLAKIDSEYKKKQKIIVILGIVLLIGAIIQFLHLPI